MDIKPKFDLIKAVAEIEDSFSYAKCDVCGKTFYRTHFVICGECLTVMGRNAKELPKEDLPEEIELLIN